MSQVRGKRRTLSQRLGNKGERIFAAWAEDRCLGANKTEEDFGIDYYCQVFRRLPGREDEEAAGPVLSAQVRGVGTKVRRPRISLEKSDAENLLRQTNVSCVIGVDVAKSRVVFRFLDEAFVRELSAFVQSDNSTLTLSLGDMESDPALFDKQLRHLARPAAQSRLRVLLAELKLDGVAPGARLRISQGSDGSTAIVDLPWIEHAFQYATEAQREPLRKVFFDDSSHELSIPADALKTEVQQVFELADEGWLLGKGAETSAELRVRHGDESATVSATVRRVGDEVAYILNVGLSLVMSAARKQGKLRVHQLHGRIFRGQRSLGDAGEALPFLKLLREGATIEVDGKPLRPAESWGERIATLGAAVSGMEKVFGALNLDLHGVFLDAVADEEFARSMSLLEAVLIEGIPWEGLLPGLVVGPASQQPFDDLEHQDARLTVPVVLNVQETGFVFRVSGPCLVFFTGAGSICGFRFKGPGNHVVERMSRFTKSVFPEMWIRTHWPAVPLQVDLGDRLQATEHPILIEAKVEDDTPVPDAAE
jgi:hypothetical protein